MNLHIASFCPLVYMPLKFRKHFPDSEPNRFCILLLFYNIYTSEIEHLLTRTGIENTICRSCNEYANCYPIETLEFDENKQLKIKDMVHNILNNHIGCNTTKLQNILYKTQDIPLLKNKNDVRFVFTSSGLQEGSCLIIL